MTFILKLRKLERINFPWWPLQKSRKGIKILKITFFFFFSGFYVYPAHKNKETRTFDSLLEIIKQQNTFNYRRQWYNPGQNVLGHLRKLGTKTHFAKLTRVLPLKKAWGCCYKGLFLLSPSPPSSVDCVELKLECITSTLHRGGRGEGRCLNLTSYCVSVPRVLTRVVWKPLL